ncbi:MAG: amino acid ABC transporter permease [Firmicutes bacterium HGW-Firmicutes-21]|nr:MAG: amino acid ABC transporter permease [Firmicutes bacterium HGW-Firmicutes-21]
MIGKSSLVEEANSRAAEESRLAAEDTSSGFVKFFRNLWNNTSNSFNNNFINNNGWRLLLKGLLVTLQITLFSAILGIFLGFIVGMTRSVYEKTGRLRFFNAISKLYITAIRGTPVVVQLLIINFIIFQSVSINKIVVAFIAFGINSGAYVAEIFRSGIMSIDNGQMEAGRSLGLTYGQTMRTIIMPQAFKNVLPTLGNEFIVLLKETSVAGFIALEDLTRAGYLIQSRTFDAFWPLIGVALIYLVIVMGLTKLLTLLERRLRRSDNR